VDGTRGGRDSYVPARFFCWKVAQTIGPNEATE
jgi:hypothetical protein